MQEILAPWAAWYGKAPLQMEFPDHWDISVHNMRGGRDIGYSGILNALAAAIGVAGGMERARVERPRRLPILRHLRRLHAYTHTHTHIYIYIYICR